MVSATPSTDRTSVNGVDVKGVLFKNNAIDMAATSISRKTLARAGSIQISMAGSLS